MANRILVPFELPDPEPVSDVLVEDLASLEIIALGHYQVPEQTPAEMAQEQFRESAERELNEVIQPFVDAGAEVTTHLEFGKDRAACIEAVAAETAADAELDPAHTDGIDRILVPLPDVPEFERLPKFVEVLCESSTKEITLFHVVEGEEAREEGEQLLEKTRSGLLDAGFDDELVDTLLVEGQEHDQEILDVAAEYDAVVMYEPSSRIGDRVFGTLADRIANETGDPVIVVARDY